MIACVVVTLLGGVVYLLATPSKPAELARIAFFVGLLWLVYLLAQGHPFRLS
jgi:hypothetical protein